MKRVITLRLSAIVLVALTSISVVYAQVPDDYHHPHFGVKVGINISGLTGDIGPFDRNSPNYNNSPFAGAVGEPYFSVNAGITVDYRISKAFSFASELLYNERGGSYSIERDDIIITDTDGTQSNGHDHYAYQLSYIEMPLILQYHLPTQSTDASYRIYAGISPAIRISASTAYTYYTDPVTQDTNTDVGKVNYSQGFTVNPIAGFWVSSKDLGHGLKIFGDMRFEYSFSNIFERRQVDNQNLQTDMWTINFGFGVRF